MEFIYKIHLYLAFAAYCFTSGFAHYTQSEDPHTIGLLIALGTLFVYNLQQAKVKIFREKKWVRIGFLIFLIIAIVYLLLYTLEIKINTWLLLMFLLLFSLGYNTRLPFINRTLRQIPMFKIWIIVYIWMGSTTLLLYSIEEIPINWHFIVVHSCFFLALALLFDLNDRKTDAVELKTIPQILGLKSTKVMAFGLLILFDLILFQEINLLEKEIFYLFNFYFAGCILISGKENSSYYTKILFDSSLIIIGVMYWMF